MLAVDFSFLKQLEGRNLDIAVRNRTLVNSTGFDVKKDGFFGYDIHIGNLKLDTFRFPTKINVSPRIVDGNNIVSIVMNNLIVSFLTDYKIKVIGFTDEGKASPVNVTLSQLTAEFYFDATGEINIKQFAFTLGDFQMKINSYIYSAIFFVIKSLVVNAIDAQAANIKTKIINKVKDFVNKLFLIDVGFGIGLNTTNIDKPKFDFYNLARTTLQELQVSPLLLASPEIDIKAKFLAEGPIPKLSKLDSSIIMTSTLSFGIQGSLYSNQDPSIRADIPPAPKMKFNYDDSFNDISILLSDYTLNTVLFMVQQSSFLRYTLNNQNNPAPLPIDTKTVSQLIPEIGPAFKEVYPIEIKFIIDPIDNTRPYITTTMLGSKLRLNASVEFYVIADPDPFFDPVKAIVLNFNAEMSFKIVIVNGKITVEIQGCDIKSLDIVSTIGDVQKVRIQRNIDMLLVVAMKQASYKVMDIDIDAFIHRKFGLHAPLFDVDYNNGYIEASINLVQP